MEPEKPKTPLDALRAELKPWTVYHRTVLEAQLTVQASSQREAIVAALQRVNENAFIIPPTRHTVDEELTTDPYAPSDARARTEANWRLAIAVIEAAACFMEEVRLHPLGYRNGAQVSAHDALYRALRAYHEGDLGGLSAIASSKNAFTEPAVKLGREALAEKLDRLIEAGHKLLSRWRNQPEVVTAGRAPSSIWDWFREFDEEVKHAERGR